MVTKLKKDRKILKIYELAAAYNDRTIWQKAAEEKMTALDKIETLYLAKHRLERKL